MSETLTFLLNKPYVKVMNFQKSTTVLLEIGLIRFHFYDSMHAEKRYAEKLNKEYFEYRSRHAGHSKIPAA
jgi:hypothetical protein